MKDSTARRLIPTIVPLRPTDETDWEPPRACPRGDCPFAAARTDTAVAVLSVSAGMVGVCLTSIGILKLVAMDRYALAQWADDLLAFTSLVFLTVSILSFQVIKLPVGRLRRWLERTADSLFVIGLAVMVVVCGLITYSVM